MIFIRAALIISIVSCSWVPKIIWTYWQDILSQNQHKLAIFRQNHKRIFQNTDWSYRMLDKKAAIDWLKDMPYILQALQRIQFKNGHVSQRSDLIRSALLKEYGGIWIDYSTILTQDLNWLFRLKELQIVQNKYGQQPQIFMTYNSFIKPPTKQFDQQTNTFLLMTLRLQTSFIAAKPNSSLINDWLNYYLEGKRMTWQDENQRKKFANGSWIVHKAFEQKIQLATFNFSYFEYEISLLTVLHRKQKQLDRQWQENKKSNYRKFAVKQYSLWVMSFQKTTFLSTQIQLPYEINSLISYIFRKDQDYLKERNIYPIFPIKTVNYVRDIFDIYLRDSNLNTYRCSEQFYINEDSIYYKFLLKDYPIKFVNNTILDKYEAKLNLAQFCTEFTCNQRRKIFIDFSQKGSGNEVRKIFFNKQKGYYVDLQDQLSIYSTAFCSNTLSLYLKGWNGINLGYLSIGNVQNLKENNQYLKLQVGGPLVPADKQKYIISLGRLCNEFYPTRPSFLNVGEIGMNFMALTTNNWGQKKCRPEVIMIKSIKNNTILQESRSLLIEKGYRLLNEFRVNKRTIISYLFVSEQYQAQYKRSYKEAQEKQGRQVAVIKFNKLRKAIQNFILLKKPQERYNKFKDIIFYHFCKQNKALVLRQVIQKQRKNGRNRDIFAFNYDPSKSQIIVHGEYTRSLIKIQFYDFLVIDILYNGGEKYKVYILDHNISPLSSAIIKQS